MFGIQKNRPKRTEPTCRPKLHETDIFMPSVTSEVYAHRAREPNTDMSSKNLNHIREQEEKDRTVAKLHERQEMDMCNIKAQAKAERRRFKNHILNRLKQKFEDYEANLDRRRALLSELLSQEERDLIRETVDSSQRADDSKYEIMKKKCAQLREANEKQRLEVVRQKRLLQYAARCEELRPVLTQKHLMESKLGQLQQMKENEARREAERELDKMWQEVLKREDEARLERETQDAILRFERDKKDKEILDMQIEGKRLLEMERKAIAQSDREEMIRVAERLKNQEKEDHRQKMLKRQKEAKDLKDQLLSQEKFAAQRRKEEHALDSAFKILGEQQVEMEKKKLEDTTTRRRYEMAAYRKHLQDLKEERKKEEDGFEEMILRYQKMINEVEREKQCKIIAAKRKQAQDVMTGRAQQLQLKREVAEKELEFQKQENEMFRTVLECNKRLDQEYAVLAKQAAKDYRNDLKKQIEYNSLLKKREMEDIENKLRQGIEEEQMFKKLVEKFINGDEYQELLMKHPFRRVLERFDCQCEGDTEK